MLRSKRTAPGRDALVFQRELSGQGFNVPTLTAGALLRDVQSDSEDDCR